MTIPTTNATITRAMTTGSTITMVSGINKTHDVLNMHNKLSSVELWKELINNDGKQSLPILSKTNI